MYRHPHIDWFPKTLQGNYIAIILYHTFIDISTTFTVFHDAHEKITSKFLRCHYNCSMWFVWISIAKRAPSLNAYSKMAASARLIYSLQQLWNFSNVSFCSSVKLFSRSLLPFAVLIVIIVPLCTKVNYICSHGNIPSECVCRAIYPRSSFISFEFVLLSSCGMMFPCHSSFKQNYRPQVKIGLWKGATFLSHFNATCVLPTSLRRNLWFLKTSSTVRFLKS